MTIKRKIIITLIILSSIIVAVLFGLLTPYYIGTVIVLISGLYYLYLIYPKFDFSKDILLNKKEKLLALTFDDGPTPGFTEEILKILTEKHVHATFFVIGKKAELHPQIVKQEIQQGSEVGAHTFNHVKLHFKKTSFIHDQISRTENIVKKIYSDLGVLDTYNKIFRSPHGFKNFSLKRYLKKNSFKLIPWTRGVWDTASPGSEWIVKKATQGLAYNEILLLHDGLGMSDTVSEKQRQGVLRALPKIIDIYQSKGYRFVKVTELLK